MKDNKDAQTLTSLILPMLDADEDIKEVFESLKNQVKIEKNKIEIIIVNDGSSDNTPETIKKHRHLLEEYQKVSIINHKNRKGLVISRFDGAKKARGKYITFIDKKTRPDRNYLYSFINKKRNIIIGNPYVDKNRSLWGRVLAIIRIKLYYPYFNRPFKDIDLDHDSYEKFKNKGGGGSMFVLREYYLKIAEGMPKGVHVNDDSLFVQRLASIEPVLKTADAKIEYVNRTGFIENILHLYNRGPKFVDYYGKPGRRFFPAIVLLLILLLVNLALVFINPIVIFYELIAFVALLLVISTWLAEDSKDFFASVVIIPVAIVSFCAGVVRGVFIKLSS